MLLFLRKAEQDRRNKHSVLIICLHRTAVFFSLYHWYFFNPNPCVLEVSRFCSEQLVLIPKRIFSDSIHNLKKGRNRLAAVFQLERSAYLGLRSFHRPQARFQSGSQVRRICRQALDLSVHENPLGNGTQYACCALPTLCS